LERIADKVGESSVVFRGHWISANSDGGGGEDALVTGLQRVCLRIDNSLTRASLHEQAIIREFLRRAHHYLPNMSLANNSLELLALMQHHGAPTRLLDWTYSLYVAAHFALMHASRKSDADLVIWTIRPDWCHEAAKRANQGQAIAALSKRIDDSEDDHKAGVALLSGELAPSIWPVNPFRLNERLTIQQGLFLAPGDVTKGFLANLGSLNSAGADGADLTRYVIPHSRSRDVARSLYRMNITEATLFPGLDGFARSLWTSPLLEIHNDQKRPKKRAR
jgi:hypothetical protein